MRAADIEAICIECAEKRGWVPLPLKVGFWPGTCDVCRRRRSLCAPRDYRRSKDNPNGR